VLGKGRQDDESACPAARASPKINGFDWVLQRILADIPVGNDDIAAMGVGGLLGEIPGRPQPRDRQPEEHAAGRPVVAALVLAAGRSSRMGRNKLLLDLDGKPILCHAVDQAWVPHERGRRGQRSSGRQGPRRARRAAVKVIEAREHLSHECLLKAGIRALNPKTRRLCDAGACTGLGRRCSSAWSPPTTGRGRSIVVPVLDGKRGNRFCSTRGISEILAL